MLDRISIPEPIVRRHSSVRVQNLIPIILVGAGIRQSYPGADKELNEGNKAVVLVWATNHIDQLRGHFGRN
jgi:hypothetical protein